MPAFTSLTSSELTQAKTSTTEEIKHHQVASEVTQKQLCEAQAKQEELSRMLKETTELVEKLKQQNDYHTTMTTKLASEKELSEFKSPADIKTENQEYLTEDEIKRIFELSHQIQRCDEKLKFIR